MLALSSCGQTVGTWKFCDLFNLNISCFVDHTQLERIKIYRQYFFFVLFVDLLLFCAHFHLALDYIRFCIITCACAVCTMLQCSQLHYNFHWWHSIYGQTNANQTNGHYKWNDIDKKNQWYYSIEASKQNEGNNLFFSLLGK